tara:strand:- start:440 stop:790 length:351 start_codon:yes stop_codon:yes gene_type:complete
LNATGSLLYCLLALTFAGESKLKSDSYIDTVKGRDKGMQQNDNGSEDNNDKQNNDNDNDNDKDNNDNNNNNNNNRHDHSCELKIPTNISSSAPIPLSLSPIRCHSYINKERKRFYH